MYSDSWHTLVVPDTVGRVRLDVWLAQQVPEHSRARWQQLIQDGRLRRNGKAVKANAKLQSGDVLSYSIPEPEAVAIVAQDIPLDVLFEDAALIVINKPAGMVVHPAPGHPRDTLVNALLHHCSDLTGIGGEIRPGIVHRLDMDTSGLLVVAKTEQTLLHLQAQFKDRHPEKIYHALVRGEPRPSSGTLDGAIGRHPRERKKMMIDAPSARSACTHYRTLESFVHASLLELRIETGRTHQIRVHLSHLGHPVLGDKVYGKGSPRKLPFTPERQLLHARSIRFEHPESGAPMHLQAPWPEDFQKAIDRYRSGTDHE